MQWAPSGVLGYSDCISGCDQATHQGIWRQREWGHHNIGQSLENNITYMQQDRLRNAKME